MNVKGIITTIGAVLEAKSPAILIGVGIGCMVAAVVTAVAATPKALQAKKEAEEEKGEPLTKVETVKTCGKYYILSLIFLLAAAGAPCIAHHIDITRQGTLIAAYAVAKEELKDQKAGIEKVFGKEGAQKVNSAVAEEQLKRHPVPDESQITLGKHPETLCFDQISGRYFKSCMQDIELAAERVNRMMFSGADYASLNDFYWEIGSPDLEMNEVGKDIGWNIATGEVIVMPSSKIAPNGQPCIVLAFKNSPYHGYQDTSYVENRAYWEFKSEDYVRGA